MLHEQNQKKIGLVGRPFFFREEHQKNISTPYYRFHFSFYHTRKEFSQLLHLHAWHYLSKYPWYQWLQFLHLPRSVKFTFLSFVIVINKHHTCLATFRQVIRKPQPWQEEKKNLRSKKLSRSGPCNREFIFFFASGRGTTVSLAKEVHTNICQKFV